MQSGQFQFKLDKTNLIKAGTIPVIAAAIGGALWLLGPLGGIVGILFWVVAAFAGYWYVNLVLKDPVRPTIVDVAINGAILGAVVGLVYGIVSMIAISIAFRGLLGLGAVYGIGDVLGDLLRGGFGGAVGAAGWYAYKTGMIKTK
jgi:hypothetical protein